MESNFVFSGVDTVYLAKKYGTPLYVLSEDIIRENIKQIKKLFLSKYERTHVYYASKAFLTKAMARIVKDEGIGIDVVSYGELYTALEVGIDPKYIMLHGNNKSYEELHAAVKAKVGRIVVDSISELYFLDEIAKSQGEVVKILFRLSPNVEASTHKYITTGQLDSKFGIPLDNLIIDEAVRFAIQSKNILLKGFHFHVGSQIFDNTPYTESVSKVMELVKTLKDKFNFEAEDLNVGGGYAIKYSDIDFPEPIEYYTDAIMEKVEQASTSLHIVRPNVFIEPGRYIVGDAGITLYSIGSIKEIPGIRKYISIDGGFADNPRAALYQAKYTAHIANKMNQEPDETVTIAGKCCESGDILLWDLAVPKVERGDYLAVLRTGAYNHSMASNYNKLPRPAVVMIKEGSDRIVVKRESYSDLLKNDI